MSAPLKNSSPCPFFPHPSLLFSDTSIEIRCIINPTMTSKCGSYKKRNVALALNSKLEMIHLGEKGLVWDRLKGWCLIPVHKLSSKHKWGFLEGN